MNEPLGIALELAARRKAFERRLSPLARRLAFPVAYSMQGQRRGAQQPSTHVTPTLGKNPTAKKAALAVEPQATVIVDVCAARWGVPAGQIYDAVRKAIYVRPRQAAMALMREFLGLSLPAIGVILRRDHSTVLAGLRKHADYLETNADYAARFDAAREQVRAILSAETPRPDTAAAGGERDGCTEQLSPTLPAKMQRAA